MKREEDWLREACALLAQEEADGLESSLTREEIRQAEELYRRHRKKALALIRGQEKRGLKPWMLLSAAAALILLFGMVSSSVDRKPESIQLAQGPGVSVNPYFSPAPVETQTPNLPTQAPETENSDPGKWEVSPTEKANTPEIITEAPTMEATALPTPTPSPAPEEPHAKAEETDGRMGWTGGYFPSRLPENSSVLAVETGTGFQRAVIAGPEGRWIFTEYGSEEMLPVSNPESAAYVQWQDVIALQTEDQDGTTLLWNCFGRSFSLTGPKEGIVEMAESVEAWTAAR